MARCGTIFNDLLAACEIGTGGIEQRIWIGNRSDIDYANTVIDATNDPDLKTCSHKITALQLLGSGTRMYKLEGIPGKRMLNATFTFNDGGADGTNTWSHGITGRAYNVDEETLCYLKNLGLGADLFAIVIDNEKGTNNLTAFKVYGFDRGLRLTELVHDYNANNGTIPISLGSVEPDLEKYPPYIWIETDYPTTLAKLEADVATP